MPHSTPTQVDPATVIDWLAADPDAVTVLDVRTPAEFETRHIAGSYNVPFSSSASTPPLSLLASTATSSWSASPASAPTRPTSASPAPA